MEYDRFQTKAIVQNLFHPQLKYCWNKTDNVPIQFDLGNGLLMKHTPKGLTMISIEFTDKLLEEKIMIDKGKHRIQNYLGLCSLLSVSCPIYDIDPSGTRYLTPSLSDGNSYVSASFNMCTLSESERKDLMKKFPLFINKIKSVYNLLLPVLQNFQFLSIFLDYYYRALTYEEYEPNQLIDAAISLESLFNEGGTDISYKLQLRCAFLLSLFGSRDTEIMTQIKNFYQARSKIVHGGDIFSKTHEGFDISRIMDYLRKSILCVFVLCLNRLSGEESEKKSFMRIIDNAMIEEQKSEELKNEISEGLIKLEIGLPFTFDVHPSNRSTPT